MIDNRQDKTCGFFFEDYIKALTEPKKRVSHNPEVMYKPFGYEAIVPHLKDSPLNPENR